MKNITNMNYVQKNINMPYIIYKILVPRYQYSIYTIYIIYVYISIPTKNISKQQLLVSLRNPYVQILTV